MDDNNEKNCCSNQERRDIAGSNKSSSMKENSHENKSIRGKRAGKKVENLKNEKNCLNFLLQNLAAQSSQNYTQKLMDESKSFKKPCNNSSYYGRTGKLHSSKVQAKGWSYRGKRAGRQDYLKQEHRKVATFLLALAQECANHQDDANKNLNM